VGRLAMMGFLTGMVEEAITGRGILGQIGFETPNPALFATIVGLAAVATFYGTAQTIYKGLNKQMTARYVPSSEINLSADACCSGGIHNF
jgi:hypothetical protein